MTHPWSDIVVVAVTIAAMGLGTWAAVRIAKAHNPPEPRLSFVHAGLSVYNAPEWFTEAAAADVADAVVSAWPSAPWCDGEHKCSLTFVTGRQLASRTAGVTDGSASEVLIDGLDREAILAVCKHELSHQALNSMGFRADAQDAEIARRLGV